jgi:putative Mn2+ efflux pump MntP
MIEVFILAFALSMDAFAVSIGLGTKKHHKYLPLKAALFFGFFQALMPIFGYLGGKGIAAIVDGYSHWVAFILLVIIGIKMIYEGLSEGIEEDILAISNKLLLMLAIATSIDAMAAGFSLTLLAVSPYIACFIIGVVTFVFSVLGVYIGKHSGAWLEGKAEVFGGVVLVLIGFKFLLF